MWLCYNARRLQADVAYNESARLDRSLYDLCTRYWRLFSLLLLIDEVEVATERALRLSYLLWCVELRIDEFVR